MTWWICRNRTSVKQVGALGRCQDTSFLAFWTTCIGPYWITINQPSSSGWDCHACCQLLICEDIWVCWSQSEKGSVNLAVHVHVLPCAMVSEGSNCTVCKYMGSERSNGKRQHTQRLSGAVAFSQLVLPTLDHHAPLVSGWEEPLQPQEWAGWTSPSCTSAVTLAWLSQHGPQWAVYLWIHDCKYPSVWEKVLSLRLCIWVTPGRTLNINKVRNHWLVWCYTNNVHLYGSHLLRSTSYKISFQPKHWVAFVTVTRFLSVLPLLIQCAINMTYLQHLQGVWREHIYCLGLLSRSMGSGW